jgi:hypothetical protein
MKICNHNCVFNIFMLGILLISNQSYASSSVPLCVNDFTGRCAIESSRESNDPQFVAGRIASGKNILGVVGTFGGSSCSAAGDLCSDGTVYAGYNQYVDAPIYVAPHETSGHVQWSTNYGVNHLVNDSYYDGKVNFFSNTGLNYNVLTAFKVCKELNDSEYLGYSDWYLPSAYELLVISANSAAINAGGITHRFNYEEYWSSTETSNNNAICHNASDFVGNQYRKDNTRLVRCIRR